MDSKQFWSKLCSLVSQSQLLWSASGLRFLSAKFHFLAGAQCVSVVVTEDAIPTQMENLKVSIRSTSVLPQIIIIFYPVIRYFLKINNSNLALAMTTKQWRHWWKAQSLLTRHRWLQGSPDVTTVLHHPSIKNVQIAMSEFSASAVEQAPASTPSTGNKIQTNKQTNHAIVVIPLCTCCWNRVEHKHCSIYRIFLLIFCSKTEAGEASNIVPS